MPALPSNKIFAVIPTIHAKKHNHPQAPPHHYESTPQDQDETSSGEQQA
jgi:hypothetical protein